MIAWRRHRRTTPRWEPQALATLWQVASLLLDYPDETLVARVPLLRSALTAVPATTAARLAAYLDDLDSIPLTTLQRDYVDTFDVTRRCALHLTYVTHGDTRKRGVALVQFKQAYRGAGVEFDSAELPDFLPVVLEFGAQHDREIAWRLLGDHRVSIEVLHRALRDRDSRWTPVLAAVRDTLPALDGTEEQALARLIAEGPPSEAVGLESAPYALDPALDHRPDPRPEPVGLGTAIPVGAPR